MFPIHSVFNHIEQEMEKIHQNFDRFFKPSQESATRFHYKIPESDAQKTLVKVGKTSLSCQGSLHVFKDFLENLISHEAERINRSTLRMNQLNDASKFVKKTLTTQDLLNESASRVKTFKNEVLLKKRTESRENMVHYLNEILQKISEVKTPSLLTETSVKEYKREVRQLIEEINQELSQLQNAALPETRPDVCLTQSTAKAIFLPEAIIKARKELQDHIDYLRQEKEQLFTFASNGDIAQRYALEQSKREKIKQYENESLKLLQCQPEDSAVYAKNVADLIHQQKIALTEKAKEVSV